MEKRLMLRFLGDLRRVRARERWPRERILAFQAEGLRRVRAHAVATSPYYREALRGLEAAPLHELPTLSKQSLMARFNDIVTDRRIHLEAVWRHMREQEATGARFLGRYHVVTSSGSSGEVTIVLASPEEHVASLAVASRGRAFGGLPWNPLRARRAASIAGRLPWLSSTQIAQTEKSRFAPLLHLGAGDPIENIVHELNAWQPEILEGYTSILGVLADEQLAGRLRVRPRMVGAGGETMTPEIRRRMREAWGDDPYDYYGTVEGGTHAVECREGRRMHVMDDELIMEVVDEENRPVPAGEWGTRVLITTLWRTTMPLIRYAITDEVRMASDACVCGRPFGVMAEIRGRTSRLLRLPSADGTREVQIPSMAFSFVANLPVTWRRLTQEGDHLVVSVVGLPEAFDPAPLVLDLEQAIAGLGARPTRVEVRRLAEIPRTAAGKAVVDHREGPVAPTEAG